MTGRMCVMGVMLTLACSGAATEGERESKTSTTAGLRTDIVDDVWVFYQADDDNTSYDNALHGGGATISGRCLFLGGAVVIWDPERASDAESAVRAALQGDRQVFYVGGGGISVSEGGAIPDAIRERCPTEEIWFASPEGMRTEP